jgi:hypothetical protein
VIPNRAHAQGPDPGPFAAVIANLGATVERMHGELLAQRQILESLLAVLAPASNGPDVGTDARTAAPTNGSDLLNAQEVAGIMRCNPRTLRSMRRAKRFPDPIQVGRKQFWRRDTVESWTERNP